MGIKKLERYDGLCKCCDCGATAQYTVITDVGFKFHVCGNCVEEYQEEKAEEE